MTETRVAILEREDSKITESKAKSLSAKIKELDQDSAKLVEIMLNKKKPYHEKLKYIKNELEESTRDVEFNYELDGFLEDTAYAIHKAVSGLQGFTKMKDNKSASSNNPPTMIDVRFAGGKRIKVPYGQINLPSFGKEAYISMQFDNAKNKMYVSGVCQKKYTSLMDHIMEQAKTCLDTDSIYKNQAIKWDGGNGSPAFMDLTSVERTKLFLTEEAQYATEPIEVRITRPETCKKNGMDLKFGVLLEGNYGTGKTLYANKLALKAIQHDWTFIYCSEPQNTLRVLEVANKFTKNGTGVVLFIEDIDKILNNRDNITNKISLLMDGSETKHNNLISIFSTNHVENIDPTFLRGKRIGSIVTLGALDATTAKEMITHLLGKTLKGSCTAAAQMIEDSKIVPAFLAEIIDRVKTHSILREDSTVTEKDILNAIKQFKRQMDIATVRVNTETEEELLHRLEKSIAFKNIAHNPLFRALWEYLEEQGYLENSVMKKELGLS